MKKYRVAIVGCGNIAGVWNDDRNVSDVLTHAKAYEKHSRTKLVCCSDVDRNRAVSFQKRWNLNVSYTSSSEMIEKESIDIVSICVPTNCHREVMSEIVEGGKPPVAIMLEKPVSNTEDDVRRIAKMAEDKGIICNVNYNRRFNKDFILVKKLLDAGELGSVQQFRALYTKGILNNGSHLVNLLHYYFGDIVKYEVLDYFYENNDDPTISLFANYSSGAKGVIQGMHEQSYSIFELEVMCDRGAIMIKEFGNKVAIIPAIEDPIFKDYKTLDDHCDYNRTDLNNAVYNYLDNTVNALDGNEGLICPVLDSLRDIKFITKLKEAI